jgi:flagellar hook-length control protein FliK
LRQAQATAEAGLPAAAPAEATQPVAAAINVGGETAAVAANSPTANSAIGAPIKARVTTVPLGEVRASVEPAPNLQDAADQPATTAKGADGAGGTNASTPPAGAGASADGSSGASPPGSNPVQQADQAQMLAADTATLPQSEAGTNSDHAAARPTTALTADASGAAGAQNGGGAANKITDSLPDFGFSAANAAQPSAAAATSGSAASTAVPVAGLPVAIAARAQEGSNQFDIRLDPPELGRIDVRLDVDSNGQVTSHVSVERAETLELLQNQQPQLERALEQAGLKTADNGLSFSLRDQSFAGQSNGGGAQGGPSAPAQLLIPDADLPPVAASQIHSRIGLGGGVDIRV